jgi:hypothetical protein
MDSKATILVIVRRANCVDGLDVKREVTAGQEVRVIGKQVKFATIVV